LSASAELLVYIYDINPNYPTNLIMPNYITNEKVPRGDANTARWL